MDEELNKELIKSDEFTILVIAKNLVLYAIVVRNFKDVLFSDQGSIFFRARPGIGLKSSGSS